MSDANAVHERLNTDLEFFCAAAPVYIKDKVGGLVKFVMNKAQRYLHARIEAQRKAKGWVRVILLKGRQQGGSTYTAVRYYHRARSVPGTSVFILSHDGKTTDKLFKMVERINDNVHPAVKPEVGASNRYQLDFVKLGSDYAVGTAGNDNVGRGGTAQLFHGSEVAYWENAQAIQDGALESIALMPGTEIILESTANGPVGLFHDKAMAALKGEGDYELVFIPWFWQDEYEREVPAGFAPTEEEETFIKTYFLKPFPFERDAIPRERALRKIAWRRAKVIDLATGSGGGEQVGHIKFRQIYPSNPVEAFQATGVGLFRADAIMAARKSVIVDESAATVAGVDVAGDSENSDRTVITIRRGREILDVIKYPHMRPMELAGICTKLIDRYGIHMMFFDNTGGFGGGPLDRVRELGYGDKVQGVHFNEGALYPEIYLNKRAEIIIEFAKWINAGDVRIPDDDDVHADLACIPLDKETSNQLKFLPSKREIKKAFGRSTDIVDSAALTFAYPVRRDAMVVRSAATVKGGAIGKAGSIDRLRRKR